MTSRRGFVGATSAGLTGAMIGRPHALQAQAAADIPPPIRALQSMRGQARPITTDERHGRIERARRLMRDAGHDALLLTGGTSLEYFTGIRWGLSERLLAAVIPVNGAAFLVTPKFEEARAMEQAHGGPLGAESSIYAWEEDEDPYALVASGLRSRGLATATIGVEETVRFVFSDGVAQLPAVRTTSGTVVTAGCRTIKDAHEIELMRLASRVTLRAYEAAWRSLRDGMTQGDFAALVQMAHRHLGFEGSAGVQVGKYSALPHGSATQQTIREGTILLIDGGCKVEGYSSDLSRTLVLGKPTPRMVEVFDVELRAQTAALTAARPGVPCEAVDAAARKVIEEAGFGPGYRHFTHRVGHGIGMDGHEWPYLVRGNRLPLKPGMVFSDEPGIYLPNEFGVRLEDDMVITESGAELFTPQSR